ncbi:MAG TPA: nucleotidyltransferase domain-containing protein [Solirubrobacteraceae bacterium]|nr:nucleotidyltransferase domain-containing protein [Solirubrobacteraceae bacterium]
MRLRLAPRPADALRTSRDPDTLKTMSSVATEELIERAGRALIDAAPVPAKVILFGSHARGDADAGSDLDFLVIEREVGDRLAEAVRLRSALRGFGAPVDVIVIDEALAQRRAKVRGTMVERALREGRLVAES